MNETTEIFKKVRSASRRLATMSDAARSAVILRLADLVEQNIPVLLDANSHDLERMDSSNPLYDRLQLTEKRLLDIAADLRHVAALPCPVGEEVEHRTLPNGIDLRRVRVPFGVIGVVYEARPNVTFDVFALCLKSGNASILKGGHDAECSNLAAMEIIRKALTEENPGMEYATALIPATHQSTADLLSAVGYVDVVIPRGGRRLIDFVRQNAKVPVIETGAGVVHAYFDESGDSEIARKVVMNAKTRRVSVCNALDTLLVHRSRISDLHGILAPLADNNVIIYADSEGFDALGGLYPGNLLRHADDATFGTEWMDYKMGLRIVGSIDEALDHIAVYGSGHSESIITEYPVAADRFRNEADAGCVYVNLPTSFTDGGQFGLGAEIGISTQKLGPRGPMGLREITTTKYLLTGRGQIRD